MCQIEGRVRKALNPDESWPGLSALPWAFHVTVKTEAINVITRDSTQSLMSVHTRQPRLQISAGLFHPAPMHTSGALSAVLWITSEIYSSTLSPQHAFNAEVRKVEVRGEMPIQTPRSPSWTEIPFHVLADSISPWGMSTIIGLDGVRETIRPIGSFSNNGMATLVDSVSDQPSSNVKNIFAGLISFFIDIG
jgi:hypothetical protein